MHTRARSLLTVLAALLLTGLTAPPAFAAGGGRPAAHGKKGGGGGEAKRHLDAGTKLLRAGDYAAARRELEQAQRLAPKATTLKLIADCDFKLSDYGKAYDEYQDLSQRGGLGKQATSDVRNALKQIEIMTGLIELTGADTPVEVFIDSKSVGRSPFDKPVRVGVGTHKVRATRDGTDVVDTEVTVKAQEKVSVPLSAPKIASTDTPDTTAPSSSGTGGDSETAKTDSPNGEGEKGEDSEAPKPEAPSSDTGFYVSAALFGSFTLAGGVREPTEDGANATTSQPIGGGAMAHAGYSLGLFSVEASLGLLFNRHTEQHGIVPNTTDPDNPNGANPDSKDFQGDATAPGNQQRSESFLLFDIGGFVGVGPRITTPGKGLRFTAGVSPGLSIRSFTLQRNTGIGVLDVYTAGASSTSFAVTADASVMFGPPNLKFMVGVFAWVDYTGNVFTPSGDPHLVVVPVGDHTVNAYVSTPPYPVLSGTQLFIGPQLGIRFGK